MSRKHARLERVGPLYALAVVALFLSCRQAGAAEEYPQRYYFRLSGLAVEQQNDGTLIDVDDQIDALLAQTLDDSGEVEFDTGFGFTAGFGYRFDPTPITLEIEYAFRTIEPDEYLDSSNRLTTDGRFSIHTIGVNVLADKPKLLGPVGFYAGLGVGVRITEFRLSTVDDTELEGKRAEVSGEGAYWQAMAGVTVSIGEKTELYGGVRWVDVGELENDTLRVDGEMVNFEFGLRVLF